MLKNIIVSLLENIGFLDTSYKKLPLNGLSVADYKISLIRQRGEYEKKLWNNWKYKQGTPEEKIQLVAKIAEYSKLLDVVYSVQYPNSRRLSS